MRYLILLIPAITFADINTTGNLITNGTFDDGTNGWTLSGDAQRIGDCCPGGHDLEFGDNGSIEQSFDLIDTSITQPMLDNGITLNSSVQVQNGECGVAGCWGGSGPADSFSIRLQIRDESNEVLATTTQERYDVTGINGEYFTDSISYTGTGSHIGNINISGSDSSGGSASLLGPNVDLISVTMTYDDTVLTATQTAILNTAFEEIEEVLTTIEPEELFIYEEFIVEEIIPFEEPQIATEMFSEVYIKEVEIEEINTGIVNVFRLAPPEEIIEISSLPAIETFEEIPMEVSYGNQETIEEIATEIQIEEEVIEVRENSNIETTESFENTGEELVGHHESQGTGNEEGTPQTTGGGVEQEPTEQAIEENETSPEPAETETTVASAQELNGSGGVVEENEINGEGETRAGRDGDDGTETATGAEESLESRNQEVEESRNERVSPRSNQVISVEDIAKKVNETVKRVDQRLIATSIIVAKAMQNNTSVDKYVTKNSEIFNSQPQMDGGNYYETRNYIDARNIYAEVSYGTKDILQHHEEKVEEATDNRIRAEEHLRRIRGY